MAIDVVANFYIKNTSQFCELKIYIYIIIYNIGKFVFLVSSQHIVQQHEWNISFINWVKLKNNYYKWPACILWF